MSDIKMDLRETGWDGVDWIDMAKDRDQWRALVNTSLSQQQTLPRSLKEQSPSLLRIEGVAWSEQRIPMAVNLGFLDPGAATVPFK
jgi:hypothetical protein